MTLDKMTSALTDFEQEVFSVAGAYLEMQKDEISARLRSGLSCEGYLNHLFAQAFNSHSLICVRETPYIDLGATAYGENASLDLLAISPDKKRSVLIEVKQVHDCTSDVYRARSPQNGHSIAGDIQKIATIPDAPGRSKFVVIVMTSLFKEEILQDWVHWLRKAQSLDVEWFRTSPGEGPLFDFKEGGWFDFLIHRVS